MVKVGFPGGPRLEWYDRNPLGTELSHLAADIAPHGAMVRASYTVPSGKKGFIMAAAGQITRATVATTLGRIRVWATFASGRIFLVQIYDNMPGVTEHEAVGQCGVLYAGDNVEINTYDTSIDGTADYFGNCNIVEFDA